MRVQMAAVRCGYLLDGQQKVRGFLCILNIVFEVLIVSFELENQV